MNKWGGHCLRNALLSSEIKLRKSYKIDTFLDNPSGLPNTRENKSSRVTEVEIRCKLKLEAL